MGSATSKNLIDITTNVITNSATKIMNNLGQNTVNSQSMTIEKVEGNVDVSNINFTQEVQVNLQGVFKEMLDSKYSDELDKEIQQEAKSLVSGINVGQYAETINKIGTATNVIKNLVTSAVTKCQNSVQLNQVIAVRNVRGNLSVKDVSLTQLQISIQNCVAEAVSNIATSSSVKDMFKQKSSSEAQGVDIWAIAMIVLLVTVGPAICVAYGAKKFVFPAMVIAGIVMLVSYNFLLIKTDIELVGYSTGISSTCSSEEQLLLEKDDKSWELSEMKKECMDDPNCIGFDFMNYIVNPKGNYEELANPVRNFYKKFDNYQGCLELLKENQDSSKIEIKEPMKLPNATGIKVSTRNIYLLVGGILTILIGVAGIFVYKN